MIILAVLLGTCMSAQVKAFAQTTEADVSKKNEVSIELYRKHSEENYSFKESNMFPGDSVTKYYRVKVAYSDDVTVHYKAKVDHGYEKLAEALQIKVRLINTNETLYEGLIKDMPESVTHKLTFSKSTTDEICYEITASLDTSTGNEYQNKDLVADFCWWVEEKENLEKLPKTGDETNMILWASLAAAAGGVMIAMFVIRRRKKGEENV